MLLPIHIAAGGLAIVLGAVALLVKKGGTIHRRSGLVLVYAMFVLGITAAILGNVLGGRPRLARHLWRMCFALFIATGSFFSIRTRVAKILPEPFTTAPMRALPILLVFGAMFYWLWRVRRRTLPVLLDTIRRHSPLAM